VGFLRIFFSSKIFLNIYSFAILLYVEVYSFLLIFSFQLFADVIYLIPSVKTTDFTSLNFFSRFFLSNFDQALFKEGLSAPY
jgi:hypothetical protein